MNPTEKTCFKCQVVKPASEFYRHPQMGDRLLSKCKECTKADVRENYRKRVDYYKAYERERANLPHRVEARKAYAKTESGRAALRRGGAAFVKRFPVKARANNAVSNALRDGRLDRKPCEVCGATKVEAHHPDYTKPLEVMWLCKPHHDEWHRHNKPICEAA